MAFEDQVKAGQAVYTPFTLRAYDWFVLGFSNRFLWRCPTRELEDIYARNITSRHLDIGVGTGYFLDKAEFPEAQPRITLVDLNPNSLQAASHRIRRYQPQTVTADAFKPLPIAGNFSSVGLCYLLHCLPGTIADKAKVFDNVLPLMEKGACLFGATIVQGDAPRSRSAQALMDFYNSKGIFSNTADTIEALESELKARFSSVRLKRRGAVALFEAKKA